MEEESQVQVQFQKFSLRKNLCFIIHFTWMTIVCSYLYLTGSSDIQHKVIEFLGFVLVLVFAKTLLCPADAFARKMTITTVLVIITVTLIVLVFTGLGI